MRIKKMSREDRIKVIENKKKRECLRCNKSFTSTWKGHRLCRECNQANKSGRTRVTAQGEI
jgi:Zn finger protein HypA/HybF involved in hydrogenase expression